MPQPLQARTMQQPQVKGVAPRRTKSALILLALLATALLAWLLAPAPLRTELAPVTVGPMQVSVDNQGQVRIHDKYILAAPVAGRLARSLLDDGDPVSKGSLLATLYPLPMDPRQREQSEARLASARALAREAELRVRRAASDLQLAASERARTQRLVAERFVSPQAMDKAQAAEVAARAEADAVRAREQAARSDVRAAEAAHEGRIEQRAALDRKLREEWCIRTPVEEERDAQKREPERRERSGQPRVTLGDEVPTPRHDPAGERAAEHDGGHHRLCPPTAMRSCFVETRPANELAARHDGPSSAISEM